MVRSVLEWNALSEAAHRGELGALGRLFRALITPTQFLPLLGINATAAELNNAADVSARVQILTASGAISPGVQSVQLSHPSVVIASTISSLLNHPGLLVLKNTSASGVAAHTVTVTTGTLNGTNKVVTLDAPNEAVALYIDLSGNGTVIGSVGTPVFSG